MGKALKEDIAESMLDALDIHDEEAIDAKDEAVDETSLIEDNKSEENEALKLLSQSQNDVEKEIIRIDMQIEALSGATVDMEKFYDTIEEHLTAEEQDLEFSDKSAYMKVLHKKAQEFEKSNSKEKEVQELKDQKKELEGMKSRQSAIIEVSKKYPDYNHESLMEFFNNDLSKKDQDAILSASSSYEEVYENTYKKYREAFPKNIKTTPPPNIPNINNTRKTDVKSDDVDNGFTSNDEKLQAALGL